jgi:superfamily II DNA or RNA helicase
LVQGLDATVLLLVGKVEKEGVVLKEYFDAHKARGNIDKEVVFLSGKTSTDEEREFWRQEAMERKDLIVIATYGIFQLGINIPPLKYLVLAAPFKSKIRVLQSIGRTLRKHTEKVSGAQIFDLVDITKYFEDHGLKRLRHYYSEKFDVKEYVLKEGDEIDFMKSSDQLCLF